MIQTPPEIQIDEVPVEIRYKGALTGLLGRIKGLYEAIPMSSTEEPIL